ncbi:enolase-phosphatase E1-like isoform X5 [Argopecten irradians]|uniref:enolase-phosphatase E1-like isoform X5 n=1 Tax=Argopecten irradians TaxID=31199 RepID=UPI00370FFD4A
METQRNYDVQAAERIFRKVVHPGLDSMRIVDRNGMPITSAPSGYTNYLKNKAFTLSPRGVPTRISNHVYNGQHTHISRYGSSIPGSESPEMYVMQASSGVKSSKQNRPYTHSSILPTRKRAMSNTSKTTRSMQSARTPSGRNSTRWYFDMTTTMPGEKRQMKSAHSEHWNKSEQGQRLNREWSSVSDSRALKRSSEILSHRVDRMYFMNGSNIRLQPKYHVDEEELLQLRDASKSRQSIHHPRPKLKNGGPSSRMSSHRGLNSGKSKASMDQAAEKTDRAKSLDNIMTTRKMDNEIDRGKSPLHGWDNDGDGEEDLSVKGEVIRKKSFHEDQIAADSASATQRSDKAAVKDDDETAKVDETVEDEFDKPERADGRQNPEDVVNTDNNVVEVDNNEEKNEEEDESWKIRKSEEEEKKRLEQMKQEEGNDEKVNQNDDAMVNENNDKENETVKDESVIKDEQEAVDNQSTKDNDDVVTDEKVKEESDEKAQ